MNLVESQPGAKILRPALFQGAESSNDIRGFHVKGRSGIANGDSKCIAFGNDIKSFGISCCRLQQTVDGPADFIERLAHVLPTLLLLIDLSEHKLAVTILAWGSISREHRHCILAVGYHLLEVLGQVTTSSIEVRAGEMQAGLRP